MRNHWRAEQHLLALDARLVPEVDLSGSPEAVDQRVTAATLAPKRAAGLAQLTRDQRDVLLLHAWAELSHEEIAAVLDIAPGTVRSRLFRAGRPCASNSVTSISTSGRSTGRQPARRERGWTMPDELDALRHFRDETPGPPGTGARAAIAAAKGEEEPARRWPGWAPGRRSHRRGSGRRGVLVIAAGRAVAAAVAGLLAVLLPNSPVTRGTGAQVETTAFVTRVERALSMSGQRNVVGCARTVYPPGTSVEPVSPGVLRVSAGRGASSPWAVGYLVRWSYQGTGKVSAFTAAGHRVFDFGAAPSGGMLTSTAVLYRSGTWWRGTIGPVSPGRGPVPAQCGPGIQIGSGGWPAFLRHALSCDEYVKGGQHRIGGSTTSSSPVGAARCSG